jgi:hypothetical protein
MAFVDDYQRLKTVLALKKSTSEPIDTFIQTLNNQWSELDDQQRDNHQRLDDLDQQLLELYLEEAGEAVDYSKLSSLGKVMLPFLAIDLQRAMEKQKKPPCRLMTQLQETGGIRGNEQYYLTSDFTETLFTYFDLPLALRRALFERLQIMTQTMMESSIDNLEKENLANELSKLRPGERLLTLAHLHRLGRLKNLSKTERKTLRRLITINDPLVKELVIKWGLRDGSFGWQVLQIHLTHYFSRRSLRAIQLVLGKHFLFAVVTLLWGTLLLTTYFQWQIMQELKNEVVKQNATDMQQILDQLNQLEHQIKNKGE